MNFTLKVWRQKQRLNRRAVSSPTKRATSARHVLPRNARRGERRHDRARRGTDRVRFRLSRRHLRHVFARDQWHSARRPSRHGDVPACTCAIFTMARPSRLSRGAPRHFRLLKDLVVDRSSFDRIIQAGGFVSVNTGGAPDGECDSVPKTDADLAMDAAACIGCGACVAACKNASAMLVRGGESFAPEFAAAGQSRKRSARAQYGHANGRRRFRQLHRHGFVRSGLPKEISLDFIAKMNRDYLKAILKKGVRTKRPSKAIPHHTKNWRPNRHSQWLIDTPGP
jgi:ferredoxin